MPPRKRPPSDWQPTGELVSSPAVHLSAFLHYLNAECGMAANTIRAYQTDLGQFFEWYAKRGPRSIQEVNLGLLTDYLEHLRNRQLAPTTVARHLVSIKMFFRYLVLEGVLLESAVELLNSPKLWRYLPQVLSPEKVNQLLASPGAAEDRYPLRDRAVLAMLYATGCRASEVSGLLLGGVHLEETYCRCLGKGNKERMVSLNPVAVSAVESYLQHERGDLTGQINRDCDWLFVARGGKKLSRMMIWRLVKKYAARIGCSSHVSPHTLRHSFATHMLAGGAEIRALQEILGHASIATTQIYTHVEHSRLKAIHQRCHPRG
jgi:integrase/recombinase XerD